MTIKSTIIETPINGRIAFATLSIVSLIVPATRYRYIPNGGVIPPIVILSTVIIPKWIGSIPTALAIGANSGPRIIIAAVPSMNIPRKRKRMFVKIKNTYLLPPENSIIILLKQYECDP